MSTITPTYVVSESERWDIINALNIASREAVAHAKDMRDIADLLREGTEVAMFASGEGGVRAAEALASQFDRNAEQWTFLAQRAEEAPQIVVCESDED